MAARKEDLREVQRQIDEWVEKTREMTGKPVQEREPWNTEVTLQAIRHYVYGTDDDNPLWHNPEYARQTRYGKIVAPPGFLVSVMYPILHGAPMLAPLASLIGGVEYEWYRPIFEGDRITPSSHQKDFYEKKNSQGRRLNFVISGIDYTNQSGDLVGRATGTMIMAEQVGEQLMFEREIQRYSDEELAELDRVLRSEKRRGSDTLYFEDVEVGEQIPPITRGPLTIGDMVAWNAAIGPSYKAGRWGHLSLKPHHAVRNPVTGFWVKNSQQHEDFNLAAGRGMPGPFDNGVMRFAWTAPLITNWMSDDGFLRRLYVQVRRPALYGDITTYSAQVSEKDEENNLVKLEITGTNQLGEVNTRGEAEVVLPRRS